LAITPKPKICLNRDRSQEIRSAREPNSGVVGFMSWGRLVEALRETKEVGSTETITDIVLEDDGLRIYYGERSGG
jgi:hypothetical protein